MTISDIQRSFYWASHSSSDGKNKQFSFVDIFAGIGGMRLGFEAAGGASVFTCEWNKYCQQTYRANFGEEEIADDIREIPLGAIPPHEVLLAGFPCQPFSIAGGPKKTHSVSPTGSLAKHKGHCFSN